MCRNDGRRGELGDEAVYDPRSPVMRELLLSKGRLSLRPGLLSNQPMSSLWATRHSPRPSHQLKIVKVLKIPWRRFLDLWWYCRLCFARRWCWFFSLVFGGSGFLFPSQSRPPAFSIVLIDLGEVSKAVAALPQCHTAVGRSLHGVEISC